MGEAQLNQDFYYNDRALKTLAALTAGLSDTRNPHLAQHGEVACSECHNAHSQSVNACSQCHSDAPIPDGWLSVSDYAAKTKL